MLAKICVVVTAPMAVEDSRGATTRLDINRENVYLSTMMILGRKLTLRRVVFRDCVTKWIHVYKVCHTPRLLAGESGYEWENHESLVCKLTNNWIHTTRKLGPPSNEYIE